jgi:hypothetical protein
VGAFLQGFSVQFGSLDCPSLIGLDLSTPEDHEKYRQNGLQEQCTKYVTTASRLVVEILEEGNNHP